ncbi:MAG: lipopolysaccharide biosynthesis protein [Phenylobacterium sp.]|nr:MAG: lipopolysaccharide biosynthesis protein [Phenylobacterium sp.]
MTMADGGETLAAAPPAETPGGNLRRTWIGSIAMTASSALRLTLQLAMLPILARLVGPAEYGLVSMAMPFILFANVLSDGGMSFALGRRQQVSAELEATVLWLSTAIGGTIAIGLSLLAWPLGALMGQPRLPLLIVALSPILLMNGLLAASNAKIIRQGRFSVFAAGDFLSTVTGAVVALVAAMHGAGAWSLVLQQLALWVVKLVWIGANGRTAVKFCWRFDEARDLIKFGMHTIGSLLADYVSRNVDNLIVGAILGASSLGFYAMAYQIVRVPDMLISGPLYLYIFTAVARAAHDPDRRALQRLAVSVVRLASAGFAPLFCGLAIIADLAVGVVLGDKWQGAIMPLRWLAGAGFFFCLSALIGATLMALGRSALQLRLSLIQGAATIVIVAVTAPFGLTAVSAGLAIGIGLVCGVYIHQLAGDLKMRRRQLFMALSPALLGVAAMIGVLLPARRLFAGAPPAAELAILVALGALVYAGVIFATSRRQLMDDARTFARAQGDRTPSGALIAEPTPAGEPDAAAGLIA